MPLLSDCCLGAPRRLSGRPRRQVYVFGRLNGALVDCLMDLWGVSVVSLAWHEHKWWWATAESGAVCSRPTASIQQGQRLAR